MIKLCFKPICRFIILVSIAAVLTTAFGIVAVTNAQDKPAFATDSNEEIRISADTLTVHDKDRLAEFAGSVKAAQGDNVIRSDKLKIFYKSGFGEEEKKPAGEESIEKLVANGNVRIRFDENIAVSEQAVYVTETRVLVLTGENSKITKGNDSISGSKITLYRDDGRIIIEGGQKKGGQKGRVEAVFYPGQKGGLR
jgi:lipopolysaccharide export system protein LptA